MQRSNLPASTSRGGVHRAEALAVLPLYSTRDERKDQGRLGESSKDHQPTLTFSVLLRAGYVGETVDRAISNLST